MSPQHTLIPSENLERLAAFDAEYTAYDGKRSLALVPCGVTFHKEQEWILVKDTLRRNTPNYNRVLGLEASNVHRLEEVLSYYQQDGIWPRLDIPAEATSPTLVRRLLAEGYAPLESLTCLIGSPEEMCLDEPPQQSLCAIRRFHAHEADTFLDLLSQSDGLPIDEQTRERVRQYYCTDTFRVYVAYVGDTPAAWATLFVGKEAGHLANAFTFEPYRGKGCQSALFRIRIQEARRLGLSWLRTDILHGTISHRNAERAGLRVATVYAYWTKNAR